MARVVFERMQQKKERGRRKQEVDATAGKNGMDYIPVAPSTVRPRDLDAIQADNTIISRSVVEGASEGIGRREEDARIDGAAATM